MNNSPADRRSPLGLFPGQPTPRICDRTVEVLRTRHYSRRTEQAYIHWIRRFIRFRGHLQDGYDIRTVQELLGHKIIKTTRVYTHGLNRGGQRGCTVPSTGCERGSPSRAGGLCGPRRRHKIPQANWRTHWKLLHSRRLRSPLGIGAFSLCRPGRVLCRSA